MHIAAATGNADVVVYLVEHRELCVDLAMRTDSGLNAAHIAFQQGWPGIGEYLSTCKDASGGLIFEANDENGRNYIWHANQSTSHRSRLWASKQRQNQERLEIAKTGLIHLWALGNALLAIKLVPMMMEPLTLQFNRACTDVLCYDGDSAAFWTEYGDALANLLDNTVRCDALHIFKLSYERYQTITDKKGDDTTWEMIRRGLRKQALDYKSTKISNWIGEEEQARSDEGLYTRLAAEFAQKIEQSACLP